MPVFAYKHFFRININKRDLFLGAPFHNADIFSVSGEGIGGGFKLYQSTVGDFTPNKKSSSINIANISPEMAGGWTWGPGSDVGVGQQTLSEDAWGTPKRFASPTSTDDGVAFRFINDLGGSWASSGQNDEAQQAGITSDYKPNTSDLDAQRYHTQGMGRSSHIAYRTKDQITPGGNLNLLRTISRRSDLVADMGLGTTDVAATAVCEMAVTAATGSKYICSTPQKLDRLSGLA